MPGSPGGGRLPYFWASCLGSQISSGRNVDQHEMALHGGYAGEVPSLSSCWRAGCLVLGSSSGCGLDAFPRSVIGWL